MSHISSAPLTMRAKTDKEAPHLTGMKGRHSQDPAPDPALDLVLDLVLKNVTERVVGPGSVSEIETAMTTGIVMSGAPAEKGIGNTEGGEGQPPQPKMINLPLRSLQ